MARARVVQSGGPALVGRRCTHSPSVGRRAKRHRAAGDVLPDRRLRYTPRHVPARIGGTSVEINRLDRRPCRRLTERVHPFFGALALMAGLASLWLVVGFFWAFVVFYGIFIAALVLLTI
jgi:hypothetical protein